MSGPQQPVGLEALAGIAGPFLTRHGLTGELTFEPIGGGGNNRVYRVSGGDRVLMLKQYFQHAQDPRDRFGAERGFYDFVVRAGIDRTPQPLGWDEERRLGLLGHVAGRKLLADEVGAGHVKQALEFILELNRHWHEVPSATLPAASEACFSVGQHLDCVGQRVLRLDGIQVESAVDEAARRFVQAKLRSVWERLLRNVRSATHGPAVELTRDETCPSPSDFGFHNALLEPTGRLRFFDFEYAGADDPAKLACDFFSQPQLPVPAAYWASFLATLAEQPGWGDAFLARAGLLLPVYRLKWCCIMLNEFLPNEQARRQFARPEALLAERKEAQLAKAQQALERVSREIAQEHACQGSALDL